MKVSQRQEIPSWLLGFLEAACWKRFLGDESHVVSFCLDDIPVLTYILEGLGRRILLISKVLWRLEFCSLPLRKINQHINSQQMLPPWFKAVRKAFSSWFVRPTLFRLLSSLTSWLVGEQSCGPLAMFHVRSWLGGKQAACSQCQQFRRNWHSSVPINFCLSHTVMQVTPERK